MWVLLWIGVAIVVLGAGFAAWLVGAELLIHGGDLRHR
jgi:hypothetical protein